MLTMKRFTIEGNKQHPFVDLDNTSGRMLFKGRSIVSNPVEFYAPIMDWFEEYMKNPCSPTIIRMEMDYFNSSSFKALVDLFKLIKPLEEKGLEVTWSAYEDDDIVDEANKIREITKVEINMEFIS